MTAGFGPTPALACVLETHAFPDLRRTFSLSSFYVDSDVWGSLPSSSQTSVLYHSSMSQHGRGPEEEEESEGSEFQAQLDQFRKLGFSSAQVRAVLMKIGAGNDTNRVLRELIEAGVEPEEREEPSVSMALPRGDSPGKGLAHCQSILPLPTDREEVANDKDALRPIVIDGSNVAMSHGNKEVFSCLGIQLAVKYFLDRGHADITVFVPSWRREQPRPDVPITDQHILRELERKKILVFTPSRRVAGKRVVCYDDRFIVKLAFELDGVIVSNDTYRDLQVERPEWKRFIEERLLMFSFVSDKFMPPDDPLGRHGPTLDNFLRKTPQAPKRLPCPYGKKCTYGIKCKFSHPERAKESHRSLADELREKAKAALSPHTAPPSVPEPVHTASLEQVMEQKLVLDLARPPKKVHTSENVPVLKSGLRFAQRKFPAKREWQGYQSLDSAHDSTQELLDSGLGSYERHSMEHHAGRSEHACDRDLRRPKPQTGWRHPHPLPGSQPCSCCCSLQSMSSSTGYQYHSMGLGTSQNPGAAPFCQPQYHSYGGTPTYSPVNRPQYSPPTDHPHSAMPPSRGYWSEPFGGFSPSPLCPMQGDSTHRGPMVSKASSLMPEREQVRKKLLAVFNARLVDRAMDMFPNLMDPQKLAMEILNLQSYEGVL